MKYPERSLPDFVTEVLSSFALRDLYPDEQRDLQPHIKEVIDCALQKDHPNRFITTRSIGGTQKPSIRVLGTSFWPDIEISEDHKPLLGIEVKYVRSNHSAAKSIAETIGQCLIYRLRYPVVIGFVLHEGKSDPKLNEDTKRLHEFLKEHRITILIRERRGSSAQQITPADGLQPPLT